MSLGNIFGIAGTIVLLGEPFVSMFEVPHPQYFHVGPKQSDLLQRVRHLDRQI